MAQPTAYTRSTNFNDYSTSNPSSPHQGSSLDAEFNAVKTTTDQIRSNLAQIQRDDGKLVNLSVHTEALSTAVLALIKATSNGYSVKGSFAASTAYAVGDLVESAQATYLCFTATSGGASFQAISSNFILLANAAIQTTASAVETFNGDGSTQTFNLSQNSPSGVTDILVFVNGSLRIPTTDYTVTSSSITFGTAPSSGTKNIIIWGTSTVVEAAKQAAQSARDTALGYQNTTQDHRDTAESYAVETGGAVKHFSGASGGTSGTGTAQSGVFSAKEHAVGTSVATGSAKDWAMKPSAQVASTDYSSKEWATGTTATSARSYAVKDDGVVTGTEYSAKAWAMSTDSNAPTSGSAKQWAAKNDGAVDTEFSAKAYASVTGTHAPTDGSAKEWATSASSAEVATGQGYSSKTYASDTSASASTTGGSAKGWAQTAEDTAVPGAGANDRSAQHYSIKAADSASAAANSASTASSAAADQAVALSIALG